jgi:ribosomal protein S27E
VVACATVEPCLEQRREHRRREPESTLVHQVVSEHLESFLAHAAELADGRGLPRFVERELRAYLKCGILEHGFIRVHCDDCGRDALVGFSCKGRGFCPSCGGRRMASTAAHLVDRVLPRVPVRQWVLSVPIRLRYQIAFDRDLCRRVRNIFVRAVLGFLRRRGLEASVLRCALP